MSDLRLEKGDFNKVFFFKEIGTLREDETGWTDKANRAKKERLQSCLTSHCSGEPERATGLREGVRETRWREKALHISKLTCHALLTYQPVSQTLS